MKKNIYLLGFIVLIAMTSCGEMREEITIKADGTGEYVMAVDIIPMMRGMMVGFAKMGLEEGEAFDSLKIVKEVEEKIWEDFPEVVDSTFRSDEKVPENIREDPEKMALIKKSVMFMKGGKKEGALYSGLKFEFDNFEELEKMYQILEESGKEDPRASSLTPSASRYRLTEKSFYRSSTVDAMSEGDPEFPAMQKILERFQFVTKINFPSDIKSVNLKHYDILEQRKRSITLRYNIARALSEGNSSEIDIQLK